jgi:hypothetical protein
MLTFHETPWLKRNETLVCVGDSLTLTSQVDTRANAAGTAIGSTDLRCPGISKPST